MEIKEILTNVNFTTGTIDRVKYIVIHYVGAEGSAEANAKYFKDTYRGASAHYFVGHNGEIVQCVKDKDIAWHCGSPSGKYVHKECRNANSIGVELCCRLQNGSWIFTDKTIEAALELVRNLMNKYKIKTDHVLRHYDVTGKVCPAPFVYDTSAWSNFLNILINDELNLSPETDLTVSNQEYIWNFLVKEAHFKDYEAAGIMGNLYAESHLMPNNLQNTFNAKFNLTDDEYTELIDNRKYSKEQFATDKAGYGIAQWTFHSRKRDMYEFIKEGSGGKVYNSIADLKGQIEFFVWELTHQYKGIYDEIKNNCKTIRDVSNVMLLKYEKPADVSSSVQEIRYKYSTTIYNEMILDNKTEEKTDTNSITITIKTPFLVKVLVSDLNIRKGPSTSYASVGYTGKGIFTIVDVDNTSKWGKLKSNLGWIYLGNDKYTQKV